MGHGLRLALTFCVCGLVLAGRAYAYVPHLGDRAADFAGRDIVADRVVHLDDYLGRWVLVEFWSAHCGPCMTGLAKFMADSAPYRDRGDLVVLFVTPEPNSAAAELKQVIADYGIDFPVLFFGDGPNPVYREWNVAGNPANYLVDPQGCIRAKAYGNKWCPALLACYSWLAAQESLPAPVGLRLRLGDHSADTIELIAELSSPQLVPLRLEVDYKLQRLTFDSSHELTNVENIRPVADGAELRFDCAPGEWGETLLPIVIQLQGCQALQCTVRVMLPGSEALNDGQGIWCLQRADYILDAGQAHFRERF